MELRPIHKKESNVLKKLFPIAVGAFIIAIMALSVLDINKNSEDEIDYNGHKFTRVGTLWTTYINDNKFSFMYKPSDLENISAETNYGNLLLAQKTYLSFNQEEQFLILPARLLMENKNILGFSSQLVLACPADNDACKTQNLPIKSCKDSEDSTAVILLEYSNTTSIRTEFNCLIFEGNQEGITKVIEKLVLKRLGII